MSATSAHSHCLAPQHWTSNVVMQSIHLLHDANFHLSLLVLWFPNYISSSLISILCQLVLLQLHDVVLLWCLYQWPAHSCFVSSNSLSFFRLFQLQTSRPLFFFFFRFYFILFFMTVLYSRKIKMSQNYFSNYFVILLFLIWMGVSA